MTDTNEIIYPQVTSIYNKLMQIGVAIILLLMILHLSVTGVSDSEDGLDKHINEVSTQFLQQAVNSAAVILNTGNKKQTRQFVESLANSDLVLSARLYDKNGQVIAESELATPVKELYGIEGGGADESGQYSPFIAEIRNDKLVGYLRLTLVEDNLTKTLEKQIRGQFELFRIMLLVAVLAGFLFTRGFSRFSRQGLRLGKKAAS